MSELCEILKVFVMFFIGLIVCLLPSVYNYLNIKFFYYRELTVHLEEQNKLRYPEKYIPFKDKIKKLFRKECKK